MDAVSSNSWDSPVECGEALEDDSMMEIGQEHDNPAQGKTIRGSDLESESQSDDQIVPDSEPEIQLERSRYKASKAATRKKCAGELSKSLKGCTADKLSSDKIRQ